MAVALCWLVDAREMDPREAQEYLIGKRHVRRSLYLQPNVRAFCHKVQSWNEGNKQNEGTCRRIESHS